MNLPADSPEWLVKAMEAAEETAAKLVRAHNTDPARAAGYFAAVSELLEQFADLAKLEDYERKQRYIQAVKGG